MTPGGLSRARRAAARQIAMTGVAVTTLVAIVHAQASPATLTLVPELRIDSATGSAMLVSWITVSPHGVIIAANSQVRTLTFTAPDGKLLGTFDGEAAGMSGFGEHFWVGDTLMVLDPGSRKYTYVGPDYAAHGTMSQLAWGGGPAETGTSVSAVLGTIRPETFFADGSMLAMTDSSRAQLAGWAMHPVGSHQAIVRVSPAGTAERIVAWVPKNPCMIAYTFGTIVGDIGVPFCPTPIRNRPSDGRSLAFVNAITSGPDSAKYEVLVVATNGDTVFTRKYPFTASPVNPDLADARMESMFRAMGGGGRTSPEHIDTLRKLLVSHRSPFNPPVQQVFVGRDGTIWLGAPADTSGQRWTVLDAKGNPLGTLKTPRGVTIADADRSNIWAVESSRGSAPAPLPGAGPPVAAPRAGVVVRYAIVPGNGTP
jgi:hypothetical protein